MERLSFDLDSEALLTISEMLLSMLMKEDLKTTADEACDDGKHADGEETDENFIVIKAYQEVDRCCFYFLYLLEYDSCKSHIFP
jgi:predicted lactoylglutathione lyase